VKAQSTQTTPGIFVRRIPTTLLIQPNASSISLADVLALSVTRMAGGPPVDRRTTPAGVLRHVRAHVQGPQFLDKVGRIIAANPHRA